MANLSLKHIYKVYPNGAKAVNDFNMDIADKEFIVFVGPSGCGKSTTLRMIAGLEDITAGELKIGNLIVNDMEPKDRDIAMVFQNYALYPHMTVYENIAFGLRLKKIPKDEIHKRVIDAAKILDLTEYLNRKPKEMSGGQRQRVSLGRAIVREPKVMLLDEPLSNLDAKLRTQMREEISKLHSRLQTTFIYVTHDQVEAMTMGTRIVVMKGGFIQQIDTPKNLYDHPSNKFVAGFIGTPQMNFFEGTLLKKGDFVEINFAYSNEKILAPYSLFYKVRPSYLNGDCPVYIGVRAEDISIVEDGEVSDGATVNVRISHKEELGSETLIYGDINMSGDGYSESSTRCIIKVDCGKNYKCGEVVKATLNMQKAHLFDKNSEESILPQIPQFNYLDCSVQNNSLRFLGESIALPPAIRLGDCSAKLIIPTDAINLNGTILAKVISCEAVLNKHVLTLDVGGGIMYAITQNEVTANSVKIGLDFKKISILSQDNNKILPMPQTISFLGKLVKHKSVNTVNKNGKSKTKKIVTFKLLIEGSLFDLSDEIAQKIISVLGVRRAFTTNLRFDCSPYDVSVSTDGIKAKFIKMLDYGKEKFALCKVGINEVYVNTNSQPADIFYLAPNVNSLSIIQAEVNVKIV